MMCKNQMLCIAVVCMLFPLIQDWVEPLGSARDDPQKHLHLPSVTPSCAGALDTQTQ
jgi:hypothetical protein